MEVNYENSRYKKIFKNVSSCNWSNNREIISENIKVIIGFLNSDNQKSIAFIIPIKIINYMIVIVLNRNKY